MIDTAVAMVLMVVEVVEGVDEGVVEEEAAEVAEGGTGGDAPPGVWRVDSTVEDSQIGTQAIQRGNRTIGYDSARPSYDPDEQHIHSISVQQHKN